MVWFSFFKRSFHYLWYNKNKYINKIVEEFQDKELAEIIVLYKNISVELIKFEMILLENIKSILLKYKKDGIFVFLYELLKIESISVNMIVRKIF